MVTSQSPHSGGIACDAQTPDLWHNTLPFVWIQSTRVHVFLDPHQNNGVWYADNITNWHKSTKPLLLSMTDSRMNTWLDMYNSDMSCAAPMYVSSCNGKLLYNTAHIISDVVHFHYVIVVDCLYAEQTHAQSLSPGQYVTCQRLLALWYTSTILPLHNRGRLLVCWNKQMGNLLVQRLCVTCCILCQEWPVTRFAHSAPGGNTVEAQKLVAGVIQSPPVHFVPAPHTGMS